MPHVLVDDIVAGSAEVGACLAVDVVDADGEGLRLENIRFAVMDAVVVAVRTFIVQRKLSEVLDEFALDAEHRGDIVGAGEAVGFRDMADRPAGFHAVSVNFPLTRFLINIGGVSDRYIFVITPAHMYIIHREVVECVFTIKHRCQILCEFLQFRRCMCDHSIDRIDSLFAFLHIAAG